MIRLYLDQILVIALVQTMFWMIINVISERILQQSAIQTTFKMMIEEIMNA